MENTSQFTAYQKGPFIIEPIFVKIAFLVGLCSRKRERAGIWKTYHFRKTWELGRTPLDIERRIYVSISLVNYLQIRSVFLVLLIDSPLHK